MHFQLPDGPDKTSARRERTLSASVQRPQRLRIRDAYLGQVCVAADDPVTLLAPLEEGPDAFPITANENGRSASVCVTLPLMLQFLLVGGSGEHA